MIHIHHVVLNTRDMLKGPFNKYSLRVDLPRKYLKASGRYSFTEGSSANPKADINVFFHCPDEHTPTMIQEAAIALDYSDTKVIFDLSERSHFSGFVDSLFHLTMCDFAHHVTCSSLNLQEEVKKTVFRDLSTSVVHSPVTSEWGDPSQVNTTGELRKVWYGRPNRLMESMFTLRQYKGSTTVYTNIRNVSKIPKDIKIKKYVDTEFNQDLKEYDIALLPVNTLNHDTSVRSPIRALNAIWSGVYPVSPSEKVFGGLSDFMYVGSIDKGIEFYKSNPSEIHISLIKGQDYIQEHYSSEPIAKMWDEAFIKTLEIEN